MLADFGVSTIATTSVGTTTSKDIAGTLNWMAPELLAVNPDSMDGADDQGDGMRPPTKESDMWSFGCLCFEVSRMFFCLAATHEADPTSVEMTCTGLDW
jgi:serine/threonine protein kinase